MMITPHLWFDNQAVEAAKLYCSLFPGSGILSQGMIRDTPSGDCDTISLKIWGQRFEAISAGPQFKLNPSISFMVNFDPGFFGDSESPSQDARQKLKSIWNELIKGGEVRMDLGEYDFSPLFGWVEDRFGVNWQLIFTDPDGEPRPPIMPSMLFTGDICGKAEEAGRFYRSVFTESSAGMLVHYPPGAEPDGVDTVMFSDFRLGETWITAADSAYDHDFSFNEAVSFIVYCDSQDEVDHYWEQLSAMPDAEQCGWLKDRYGVSWQIVPELLNEFMEKGTEKQQQAVTAATLKMKKLDIEGLKVAYSLAG